ncbi:hypothetical protein [Lacrimispora sp.]|uniref:hypothetical protein n=1 Tax=Lacrimispora sp. TaxID=2719234 RepID=UPI0028639314|nr:hypothetical protein [Lacrimispora sp.]MDR7814655.1 hypothetical protein [Lacrimispora sp.]
MEKVVIKGTKTEVIEAMKEKGYKMEGFNDISTEAGYFYAYKEDYQGADYFTIFESRGLYTLIQY